MTATNLHVLWASRLVTSLVEAGVRHVFVSPGSRSTPIVLAIADEARLAAHVVLDERSAAFLALGVGRASGTPAAVVATSGTAPAHWLPAVIEASESHTPLVLLSADRPWEAQHASSPQTVDQIHLFGRHARRFIDVGAPDASPEAQTALSRVLAEALAHATWPTPGPVHVNARFRKPLEPLSLSDDAVADAARPLLDRASPRIVSGRTRVDPSMLREVAALISSSERGLVAAGPMPPSARSAHEPLASLATRSGFAVYAEATSQLRAGLGEGAATVPLLDLQLRAATWPSHLLPDVVVELGAPPVATSWAGLLGRASDARRIVLTELGAPDPRGDAHTIVRGDLAELLATLADLVTPRAPTRFASELVRRDRALAAALGRDTSFGEGTVTRLAAAATPADGCFLVGNSSPVRDVDTFAPVPIPGRCVLHQRGASGIDGLVAQTIAATIATSRPVVSLLGDLTFFHDAASLASARLARAPAVIVVVDNGGGRIFDELPIARVPSREADLARFFTTPQAIDPRALTAAYDVAFTEVSTERDLARALERRLDGVHVVWVKVPHGSSSAARARALASLVEVTS